MALCEIELKRVDRHVGGLCRRRSDPDFHDELHFDYEVKGHDVVIFARRPAMRPRIGVTDEPIAKLKFVRTVNEWRLYRMRSDMKWHGYPDLPASRDLQVLVEEIDADPCNCFFG